MTVYGFKVKLSGFLWSNPLKRHEVISYLRPLIENHSVGFSYDWKKMAFPDKCKTVIHVFGVDAIYINAVQGAYLGPDEIPE